MATPEYTPIVPSTELERHMALGLVKQILDADRMKRLGQPDRFQWYWGLHSEATFAEDGTIRGFYAPPRLDANPFASGLPLFDVTYTLQVEEGEYRVRWSSPGATPTHRGIVGRELGDAPIMAGAPYSPSA